MLRRRTRMGKIEHRIARLDEQAARLLERERQTAQEVLTLQRSVDETGSRIRAARQRRALSRRATHLARLKSERQRLVHDQLRWIMFALQDQAQRTRDELDRQLDQLAPIQDQWERLRTTFASLEGTVRGPAFVSVAEQWQGQLDIPEFPLAQRDGYAKPFPQHALLF